MFSKVLKNRSIFVKNFVKSFTKRLFTICEGTAWPIGFRRERGKLWTAWSSLNLGELSHRPSPYSLLSACTNTPAAGFQRGVCVHACVHTRETGTCTETATDRHRRRTQGTSLSLASSSPTPAAPPPPQEFDVSIHQRIGCFSAKTTPPAENTMANTGQGGSKMASKGL